MTITFSQLGNQGRLGNQLWQIAATIAAAKNTDEQYLFPPWKYEEFFNLHGCFSDKIIVSKTYLEPHFHYAPIPKIKNIDLSGYYQSFKYFEQYDDIIRHSFEYHEPVDTQQNTTSIHVRRGDYIEKSEYHNNLFDSNYYEKAIELTDSDKYLIFSDDISFCKTKFRGNKFLFVENGTPQSDLVMMSSCANNIIANSSFSWWAAYLNKNDNKKVIAPKTWFGPKLPHDTKDLIPNNWIKI